MPTKLLSIGLVLIGFEAFCQISLKEQSNNFSSGGGQLSASSTVNLFSVVGQPVAHSSPTRSQTQAGYLQAVDFVVVDGVPPDITHTAIAIVSKQAPHGTISALITDNIQVATAKIRYRRIAESTWSEATLTGNGDNYSAPVLQNWFDAMGMEYYLKATDAGGNSDSTGNYYAYTTSAEELVPNSRIGFVSSGIGKASDYKIFAFPYATQNNDFTSPYLFDEIAENPNNNTQWRLARYNNQVPVPEFEDFPRFRNLERGRGYWILVKNSAAAFTVGPVEPFAENRSDLYEMQIRPGWNMIGNPYPVPIDWNDVRALNNNPDLGVFYKFTGSGSYTTDDQAIAVYEGGFVMFHGDAPDTIKIPFFGQTTEGGRINSQAFNDVSEDTWLVKLKIGQQDQFNELGGFGMHPSASVTRDEFDTFNPPAFLNTPKVDFLHPEHRLGSFSRDITSSNTQAVWKFKASGVIGHPTELVWDNDLWSGSRELFLVDEKSLSVIDMRQASSYSFMLAEDHTFSIFYGKEVSLPGVAMTQPFPNPSRHFQDISFRFNLPNLSSQYALAFELHDGKGTIISETSYTYSGGVHELRPFPPSIQQSPGMFFYRVRISDGNSQGVFTGKLLIQ